MPNETKRSNSTKVDSIKPGLMVHARGEGQMKGAQGKHVGTVDHLDGGSYIKLTKNDSLDKKHHWIPIAWVERIDDKAIYLNKTEDQARAEMFDSFPGESQEQEAV